MAPDTPLARLCRYYLDCLAVDGLDGVSVLESGVDLEYVELASNPLVSPGGLSDAFEQVEVRRLLKRMLQKRQACDLFVGYPVLVHQETDRDREGDREGWGVNRISPLFLYPLQREHADSHAAFILSDEVPQLNLRAFGQLLGADGRSVIEQVAPLQEELGLGFSSDYVPEADELAALLREIMPGWGWRDDEDSLSVDNDPGGNGARETGIYNRAVLVMAERPHYTRGLEWELRALQNLPKEEYAGTALEAWLGRKGVGPQHLDTSPLIEIFPLNPEQRRAVRQGLQNDLTVVTGPPGTGKSQVVGTLLINAAWKGKRVLFASKNNKAVDVVEERVNEEGPLPTLMRVGSRDREKTLADHLEKVLSFRGEADDDSAYQAAVDAHEAIADRLDKLAEREREIIELRNRVDVLEQAAEPARREAGEAAFPVWGAWPIDDARKRLGAFKAALRAADHSRQGFLTKLLWNLVKAGRRKRLETATQACLSLFEVAQTRQPARDDGTEFERPWAEPIGKLETWLDMAGSAKDYFDALTLLESAGSLEGVAAERHWLTEELKQHSSDLWERWLRLMPDRLTADDRRTLGQYIEALDAGRAWRWEGFPSSTGKFLPCWAVTSLSARRRIPFTAGFFDLLVVDEASQCDIASALPLLYRAKRVMVIGDRHQLRHISALPKKKDEQLLARNDASQFGGAWSYPENALYDLADQMRSEDEITVLKEHYRSHAQIIGFSNQRFYNEVLRVATRYGQLLRTDPSTPAVRWIDVPGQVVRPGRSAVNEKECQAVVGELHRLVLEQGYEGEIGVVSPFRAQVERIKQLVAQDNRLSLALRGRRFQVDTAHGFQGDERDVIIFSPVVSTGLHRGAKGFLSETYNLFNVAITRAKAALVVVGDRTAVANSGIKHLEKLPEYVDSLVAPPAKQSTTADLGPTYPPVDNPGQVSEWERQFYEGLYAAGLRPRVQYPVEQYLLDFALLAPGRKLDIEVDGERYHKNWDGELLRRDQIRNQRLIELGWDVMRFWVYQIRDDFDACIEKVQAWADAARD